MTVYIHHLQGKICLQRTRCLSDIFWERFRVIVTVYGGRILIAADIKLHLNCEFVIIATQRSGLILSQRIPCKVCMLMSFQRYQGRSLFESYLNVAQLYQQVSFYQSMPGLRYIIFIPLLVIEPTTQDCMKIIFWLRMDRINIIYTGIILKEF